MVEILKQEKMNTKLKLPKIIFGGNVFGWTLDEKESFRILDILWERGYRNIDTADSYGNKRGLSESIIGRWMKERGNREVIFLATKVGRTHQVDVTGKKLKGMDNDPEYLKNCLLESLERLQTSYVDLYYTHFDDAYTPLEDVLKTHKTFLEEERVKFIGASNYSVDRWKEVLHLSVEKDLPKYDVLQAHYNLVERQDFEENYRDICVEYDVKVASYFSLASGFLTGKYKKPEDFTGTARQGLTEKYWTPQGLEILKILAEVAEEHGVSRAAVSLAWILTKFGITSCVASATKEKHIDAFDEAMNLELSIEEIERLNTASDYL